MVKIPKFTEPNDTFLNVGRGKVGHTPSLGYDHLDGGIGRLHNNIQILATLSKKSSEFFSKGQFFTFLLSNS